MEWVNKEAGMCPHPPATSVPCLEKVFCLFVFYMYSIHLAFSLSEDFWLSFTEK